MFLKSLALLLIRGYQKFISPYKGYSCALRVHGGGHSCSRFGYDAIERHGFLTGLVLLRRRMAKCSWHAHQHNQAHVHKPAVPSATSMALLANTGYVPYSGIAMVMSSGSIARRKNQAGFVDCDCSGCDAPSCDLPSCDVPSCDVPSCELPSCDMPACDMPFSKNSACSCGGDMLEGVAAGCDAKSCQGCNSSGCGSGSGFEREQRRLEAMRKRREEKKNNANDDTDFDIDGDDGDGD